MKKLISFLLIFSLLIPNCSFGTVFAATVYSGYCGAEGDGTNIRWTFDSSTGTLSIVGTGKMKDWRHPTIYDMYEQTILGRPTVYIYTPWYDYRDKISHASISDGVTTIGDFTFSTCKNLKDVSLGKDLTTVGVGSFESCTSLTSINIPSKVESIGVGAFYNATGLSSVILPDGLKTIYYGAFAQCYALRNISIPSTVTQMNAGAFAISGITSIVLPEGIGGISSYTFYQCTALQTVKFLGDIKYINECAFASCSNLTLRIPDTCTAIDPSAFSMTSGSTDVALICYAGSYGETFCIQQNIPKSMYQVREHAFGLNSVVSPTCTESGYSLYYCKECDGYRKQNYTNPVGHNMGNWRVSAVATAASDGTLVCSCTACDEKKYKSYPYHTPGDTDLDEELTVYDVILLLQQMAGIKDFDEYALSAGDLNLNYAIDTEDATLLLQRISGSKIEFPSEHPESFRPQ